MTDARRRPDLDRDHAQAVEWASNLVSLNDWVILDTETTGMDTNAEIVEIAIIGCDREILINTRVRPSSEIEPGASDVHGICREHLADAPNAAAIWDRLQAVIEHKIVIAYNEAFDRRMLKQTAARYGLDYLTAPKFDCAMLQYAAYCGEWVDKWSDYKYQHLPHGGHSALADCRATWRLIQRMARDQ